MAVILDDNPPAQATKLFVVGGDLHLHSHAYANQLNAQGIPNRIAQGMRALELGFAAAQAHRVPFIVNGDLTHVKAALDPVVTSLLAAFFKRVEQSGTPVYLVPGNHEKPEKFRDVSTLDAFDGTWARVVKTPSLYEVNGARLVLCPFYYDHKKAANQAAALGAEIFVGHFPTSGVNLGKHTLQCDVLFEDFHPRQYQGLLFSDIHKHQPVGNNGYHLGAPMQNNFGEEGYDCGWWLVSRMGETVYLSRIPVNAPRFYYVETAEEAETLRASGHYARIRPQAIVKRLMETEKRARLDFNLHDMDATVQNYIKFQVDAGRINAEDAPAVIEGAREVLR